MKKIILTILAIVGIVFVFVGYRVYVAFSFFSQTKELSKSMEYEGRGVAKSDDNNFPEYLKSFSANDDIKGNVEKLQKLIPSKENLYDTNANKQLVMTAEPMFSKNLDNFKNIVPIIKKKMKETKKDVAPTFKESESFPTAPTIKTIKGTARYWYIVSRLLDQKKDYETSLYLSLAMFYFAKDLQTNYLNSGSLEPKIIGFLINGIACNSIFVWASKPKLECKEISKEVAKDILDFVKADCPISKSIEFECLLFDEMLSSYEKKGSDMFARLRKSSDYKNLLDFLYKEPMRNYYKPLYEIKKELKEHADKQFKLLGPSNSDLVYYFFFNPERLVSINLLALACPSFEIAKWSNEVCLAKMEMAAIALVINSYICENRKKPKSMEELSKWFGRELPINRITNEPYNLDFDGEHVLYNENFDETKAIKDEFYFNFSLK